MSKGLIVVICFLLPLLALCLLMKKKRSVWVLFIAGMLAFFIAQIILRLPLLQLLGRSLSFNMFAQLHPVVYVLFLAVSAGVFEEVARAIGMKLLRKRATTIWDALAFGFGHGGIEAAILVGFPLLHMDVSLEHVWIACVERMIAISVHVALSLIVWWGIMHSKAVFLGIAVLLHAMLDSFVIIPVSPWGLEACLLFYAAGLWLLTYRLIIRKRRRDETYTKGT